MNATIYRIRIEGDRAKVDGYAGKYRVHHREARLLVLVREGYGENPGSRNSGLHSYYPAAFQIYHQQQDGTYLRVTEFPVRREAARPRCARCQTTHLDIVGCPAKEA